MQASPTRQPDAVVLARSTSTRRPFALIRPAIWWLDAALSGGLVCLALWLRLPYLNSAPTLSNDADEIHQAARIGQGLSLPLVSRAAYIGAWHSYLTALAFRFFSPSVTTARGLSLVLAVATVLLTWMEPRS